MLDESNIRIVFSEKGAELFRDGKVGEVYTFQIPEVVSSEGSNESTLSSYIDSSVMAKEEMELLNIDNDSNLSEDLQDPQFLSVPEKEFEYIGYVLEKQRYDIETNSWKFVDIYKILISSATFLLDSRIVYGQLYRYRIRAILRITRPSEMARIESNYSQDINRDSETQRYFSQYFSSIPSKWFYLSTIDILVPDFPSSVNVVPCTQRNEMLIYWQYPNDSDKSIAKFRVYRREETEQKWDIVFESNVSKNTKKIFTKTPEEFESTMGKIDKMELSSLDGNNTTITKQLITKNVEEIIDSKEEIGEELYRKKVEKVDYQYKIFDNFYVDRNVELGKKYIYAVSAVDVHNLESFLSLQIKAQLNENYNIDKEEIPLVFHSSPGVNPQNVKTVIKRNPKEDEPIIATNKIKFRLNTKFNEDNISFIVKIKSLDIHETEEIKLTLKNVNITKR